ncbi:MAG: YdcF family protein [Patescibacteria group bacterium]
MEPKEVVVIFAGGFAQKNGQWISRRFGDDGVGPPGSDLRMLAGAYLYQEDPSRLLITSGGRGYLDSLFPLGLTMAGVIKRELVGKGVPADSVIEEFKSSNTYSQLSALQDLALEYKFTSVLLVSSSHHLPRIEAMLKYAPGLREIEKIARTVSADEVVIKKDLSWKKVIETNYNREPLKSIIEREPSGIEQIKNGTYKFK